ncbi:MAG: tripartite tricarboxylate transporter permease [Spirochaetales bacterium]|nr:tripartite tricarboxylate transporter permease [Spirochaetales bacterium]
MIDQLTVVLREVLTIHVLGFMLLGVTGGMAIGALPGLTATMGVAILVPFTFSLPPLPALVLLVGIYVGAIQGGSIPAVMIRTPGTPAAAATSFDGYPLSLAGRAEEALSVALFASFFGGLFGTVVLAAAAPVVSRFALRFGPAEYTTFGLFGLSMIVSISGRSLLKGCIAAVFGLILASIGLDPVSGVMRFTFGSIQLMDGLSFIPIMIGLFAISEVLKGVQDIASRPRLVFDVKRIVPTRREIRKIIVTLLRSSVIGSFVGSLPGAGGDIAAFISYNEAKRASKTPERFGKGEINGIAAAESANNAVCEGAMIPLLTLGIPGDSVTAVLIGAFMIQGLRPGPLLYAEEPILVHAIIIGFVLANVLNYVVALFGARLFARLVSIRRSLLLPVILLLCIVGSYGIRNAVFDIFVMLAFGVVGYLFQKRDVPLGPIVLALILGPTIERNLRRALVISDYDLSVFVTRPISLTFLVLAILSIATSIMAMNRRKNATQGVHGHNAS